MNFWDFLNWLHQAIDKVLAWFGAAFWTLYDGASNALKWAIQQAGYAYDNAKAWVIKAAYATYANLIFIRDWLEGLINTAYKSLTTAISTASDDIKAWAKPLIQGAKDFATGLYKTVVTWAIEQITIARIDLINLINKIKGDLHDIFDPLLALKPNIAILNDLSTGSIYNKLKSLVTTMFGTLNILVTNPLGFITGLLFPIFAEVFCYAIGYGLGAIENQLPPIPGWGHGGGGGVPPPYPVPPGTGVLIHPVDPIWVSGYSFNPPTHPGVDLGISYGQEVVAMHNGVVLESGWSNVGYGNTVVLQNDTWWSRYGHFETCLVQAGQEVSAGQLIGYGNTTGNSTGNHLHLELKLHGTYVDPLLYL